MAEEKIVYLPETMKNWPWKRCINPNYEEMKNASNLWLSGFQPFTQRSQFAFDKCDLGECDFLSVHWWEPDFNRPSSRAFIPLGQQR
jgi:hypothetical protein